MRLVRKIFSNAAFLLTVSILLSKIAGFVREVLLAYFYGASMVSDSYVMARTIPEVMLSSLITSVGVAYMPTLAKTYELDGKEKADRFTSQLAIFMSLAAAAVIILGELFSKRIVKLFAPGFSQESLLLTDYFLRVSLLLLIGSMIVSIFSAYIQYVRSVVVPSVIGIVQSLSVIAFIMLSAKYGYRLLTWGIVAGYSLQGLLCCIFSVKFGFKFQLKTELYHETKEVIKLTIPVFVGSEAMQLNAFVDKMLASNLHIGSVSALNYGHLVYNFISIFAVTIITTAAYPKLTKAFSQGDFYELRSVAEISVIVIVATTIPLCLASVLYSREMIQLIYERGEFASYETAVTSNVFLCYALGLAFFAIDTIYTKIFYSMRNMNISMCCSLFMVLVNIVLDILMVKPFGVSGLALATSVAGFAGAALRVIIFQFKFKDIKMPGLWKAVGKILMISMISVSISYLTFRSAPPSIYIAYRLTIACAILAICYVALFALLKVQRMETMMRLFQRGE